jgi:hypothetical protein
MNKWYLEKLVNLKDGTNAQSFTILIQYIGESISMKLRDLMSILYLGASMVKWTEIVLWYAKTIIFLVEGLKVVAKSCCCCVLILILFLFFCFFCFFGWFFS